MNPNIPPNLYMCAALVAFGIVFHFLSKLAELETNGKIITPWQYWTEHPYTSLTVILGAYLFMGMQFMIGELTYSAALLTGIACNSLGDKLRAAANEKADQQAGVVTRQVKVDDPNQPPKG